MRINFSSWQPLWGPEDPAPWYPQVLGPFCPKVLHTLFLAWESLCPPPLLCSFLLHLYHLQCSHTASIPHHSTGLAAPPGHITQGTHCPAFQSLLPAPICRSRPAPHPKDHTGEQAEPLHTLPALASAPPWAACQQVTTGGSVRPEPTPA